MGQKINPTGYRLAVTKDWSSMWYANKADFAGTLIKDVHVREFIKERLKHALIGKISIKRTTKSASADITILTSRPGVIIGKKGDGIDQLRTGIARLMGVKVEDIKINIEEERKPEVNAKLIAYSLSQQLEKRVTFRRAMKRAMLGAMRAGAKGIKVMSSGRLNGAEIARTEWYREGRVPLHTLRADIDYAIDTASTTYGQIGVKVWVYKGDMKSGVASTGTLEPSSEEKQRRNPGPGERRARRDNDNNQPNRRHHAQRRGTNNSRANTTT